MIAKPPRVETLVVDLDNTLYDWVAHFIPSLAAMIAVAADILGTSESQLREELRRVHQAHGNTEHPFALLETESALRVLAGRSSDDAYQSLLPAFEAFNRERNNRLRLYAGVRDTLETIRSTQCLIVGHTDATTANIKKRIDLLAVNDLLDFVYATPFTGSPHPAENDRVAVPGTVIIRGTPDSYRKPDPRAVLSILSDLGAKKETTLYVGDSLKSDVDMAQRAGVMAAWAKYGVHDDSPLWAQLVEVSHWKGPALRKPGLQSTPGVEVPALGSFDQLLDLYTFGRVA